MQIEELEIGKIKPYEKNPRKNDGAVDGVAESIKQFGFKQPIVVDKDCVIVAGHTRYKAAKKLGMKTVPCVRADDLTEEQVKAYRILDNKLNELASWDFEALQAELDNFGYQLGELDKYLPTPSTVNYVVYRQDSPATDEGDEGQVESDGERFNEPAQRNYDYSTNMKQEFTPLSNDDRLKLIVHFKNASDIVEFGEKIGVPLREGIKTVLF